MIFTNKDIVTQIEYIWLGYWWLHVCTIDHRKCSLYRNRKEAGPLSCFFRQHNFMVSIINAFNDPFQDFLHIQDQIKAFPCVYLLQLIRVRTRITVISSYRFYCIRNF